MKTTSTPKLHDFKRGSMSGVILVIVIIGVAIFFTYMTGVLDKFMPKGTTILPQSININMLEVKDPKCNIEVNPENTCSGNSVTGTITASKNTLCGLYLQFNNDNARLLGNVLTDAQGHYTVSQSLNIPGTYKFSMICGSCADTDSVIVEFCDSNNEPTCLDSDNGKDIYISGNCQSNITITDECQDINNVIEGFCLPDKSCSSEIISCPVYWACIGGQCVRPTCSTIINPQSQSDCNIGYCNSIPAGCMYHEATLGNSSYCGCI